MDFFSYLDLFNKYGKPIISIFVSCILVAVSLIVALPKKYKSVGILSVSAKYFQNPLVREFITETFDSNEMKSQRESLIIASISDDFVDQIANKYHLYDEKLIKSSQLLSFQRSSLRKKIEIVPLNSSTSQISFYCDNPAIAQEVVQQIFQRIIGDLKKQRQKTLVNLRASMKKRIDSLIVSVGFSVDLKDSDLASVKNPILMAEREKLKTEINEKLKFYNKNHPVILALHKQLKSIEFDLELPALAQKEEISPKEEINPKEEEQLLASNSINVVKAKNLIYEDLIHKFEYLNIAINSEDLESASYLSILQNPTYPVGYIFPNKSFFLMLGTILGFLFSALYVVVAEVIHSNRWIAVNSKNEKEVFTI